MSTLSPLSPPALLLFLVLLAVAACDRPAPPDSSLAPGTKPTTSPSSSATPSPSSPAPSSAQARPASEGPRFTTVTALSGGKSMSFRLFLERKGDEVEGFLFCDAAGQATRLQGKMLDERRFRAEEPGKKGKTRGVLEGELDGQVIKVASWFDGKKKNSKLRPARLTPFDARESAMELGYRGAIGEKLQIRAQLKRDGKQLTGFYRYARSREDLQLRGSVDPESGKFDLRESSAAGTTTGRLQGTFLRSGFLVGTWSSADGARTLPFYLENSRPLAQITELPGGVKVIPREEDKQPSPRCSVSSSYPELDGMKDRKAQDALNRLLRKEGTASIDPRECQEAAPDLPYSDETSYALTSTKKKGYLGVSFEGYSYRGGAHGMGYVDCKVIDLEQGELVSLAKLLHEDALPKLNRMVNEALRREHKTEQLSEAGFFDDEVKVSETTNLCLLDSALEIVFNNYEVAPYAMGRPTVQLPLSDVAPLFKKTPLTEAVLKLLQPRGSHFLRDCHLWVRIPVDPRAKFPMIFLQEKFYLLPGKDRSPVEPCGFLDVISVGEPQQNVLMGDRDPLANERNRSFLMDHSLFLFYFIEGSCSIHNQGDKSSNSSRNGMIRQNQNTSRGVRLSPLLGKKYRGENAQRNRGQLDSRPRRGDLSLGSRGDLLPFL
ncbi:MAG: DUF3298 and DUF4163 domain-containing protein [Myxococcales bacterium]|nr:DUF3298 and DUF4163 domain-containing protein [Polyangiaceae bacterium]MDW8249388.1 DUF3298 and DUF4163 domain-containing protein [Myxococcales bacterium]